MTDFADVLTKNPSLAKYNKVLAILGGTVDDLKIPLPRIVVAGTQSAGKSALLQAIVGHRIFPTASGMCTRAPLLITMMMCSQKNLQDAKEAKAREAGGASEEEVLKRLQESKFCVVFSNAPKTVFFDPSEIQDHIVKTTHDLTSGRDHAVSSQEIVAAFYGVDLPMLTIIDLPGHIVQYPPNPRLPAEIDAMIKKYITNPQTTILAVHDVGVDTQNDPVLAMILDNVDKDLNRTIVTLTKMDRMQASDINRVTADVKSYSKHHSTHVTMLKNTENDKMDMQDILEVEAEFFRGNHMSQLRHFFPDSLGSRKLALYLSAHLDKIVRDSLGSIQDRIEALDDEWSVYLESLPKPVTQAEATVKSTQLTSSFVQDLCMRLNRPKFEKDMSDKVMQWVTKLNEIQSEIEKFNDQKLERMIRDKDGIHFISNDDNSTMFKPVLIEAMDGEEQANDQNKLPKLKIVCLELLNALEAMLLVEGELVLDLACPAPPETSGSSDVPGSPARFGKFAIGDDRPKPAEIVQPRGKYKQFPEFHREAKRKWTQLVAAQKQEAATIVRSTVDSSLIFFADTKSRDSPKKEGGVGELKKFYKKCFEEYILRHLRVVIPRHAVFVMRNLTLSKIESSLSGHIKDLIGNDSDPNTESKFFSIPANIRADRGFAMKKVDQLKQCREVLATRS
eukprot:c12847_g1_i1.p1 GENE.c12847_g1_i1~~c12847_g1_i1.p1  ORF type:complete len:676 (-),score=157.49 c12847_g1_i1:330-2357(-)